jgi:leucyl aminopeptidase
MEITLARSRASELDTDVLIFLEWEGTRQPAIEKTLAVLYDSGEVTGKFLQFTLLHGVAGFKARRVLIVGAGKKEKMDTAALRRIAGAAVRFLKGKGARAAAISLDSGDAALGSAAHVAAVVEGAMLAAWEPDYLKKDKEALEEKARGVASFTVVVESGGRELDGALERARIVAEAMNLSRDISVKPPNLLDPLRLAEEARAAAASTGLSVEVLDEDRMRQLGMGALLGVAQGSAAPPALIVIQYRPENSNSSAAHLGFVGKGVTFDTGGISIKPAEGMEKMKYDMAGGASVIGAMQAIARLKPPVAVTGIIPAVENMPGAKAQRPGDIVTSMSGKTIEVINTDAEGRLILADAITYAKRLGCTHLVDTATLTGAIVVALGHTISGVFSNNDDLRERWMNAASEAGEKMWHMPLEEEHKDLLKTVYADIQNVGGRWGGACSAAAFIQAFVDETPWVHVDIAGTGWIDDAKPYLAKGPTGTPVGSFVNLAMNWK